MQAYAFYIYIYIYIKHGLTTNVNRINNTFIHQHLHSDTSVMITLEKNKL